MTAAAPARSAPQAGVAVHAPPAELGVRETLAATLGDACLSTNPRDADATDIPALLRAAL